MILLESAPQRAMTGATGANKKDTGLKIRPNMDYSYFLAYQRRSLGEVYHPA